MGYCHYCSGYWINVIALWLLALHKLYVLVLIYHNDVRILLIYPVISRQVKFPENLLPYIDPLMVQ